MFQSKANPYLFSSNSRYLHVLLRLIWCQVYQKNHGVFKIAVFSRKEKSATLKKFKLLISCMYQSGLELATSRLWAPKSDFLWHFMMCNYTDGQWVIFFVIFTETHKIPLTEIKSLRIVYAKTPDFLVKNQRNSSIFVYATLFCLRNSVFFTQMDSRPIVYSYKWRLSFML